MKVLLCLLGVSMLATACDGGLQPTGPRFVQDSCGVFGEPPASITGWIPAESYTCVTAGDPQLRHDAPMLYDDCSAQTFVPDLCSGTAPERSFCELGAAGIGRLSALCAVDSDCPEGASCYRLPGLELSEYGQCEARCSVDSDCVRCELTCDLDRHVCVDDPAPDLPGPDPLPPLPAP